jgi:PAS domain S-box-containing protein
LTPKARVNHPSSDGEAQDNASQKEKDLLKSLENLPDGLLTMDKEGKITYFNAAAERITGISSPDAMGMHCRDIFKDRSDHRRLEEDLRRSENKYRRIFEGSKDIIFITAKDGSIRDVNQASVDLLGFGSKEELLSLQSVENIYVNPMHWRVFKKQIDRQGFVRDFEARFKRKDGARMHCLLSGNAVRNEPDGQVIGYEGIAKDITPRMDAIRNLQRSHRELSLLNAVALVMNATQDLDEILMTALENVLDVLSLASGGIFLIDHNNAGFLLHVQRGLFAEAAKPPYELQFLDQALMESLLKKDLVLEPKSNFLPFSVQLKKLETASCMPLTCFLITAKEKASGFFALDLPPQKPLTVQDYHLLGSLGNFLGGAVEKSRLLKTIHEHREELKGLTAKLFQSQEFERRRIARELHDEAGQALTGISFSLETIEKSLSPESGPVKALFADVKKQINRTYQGMRRLSYKLHPPLLSDLGLEPALDSYLTRISKHSGLNIDFKMVGFAERLDLEIETVLYRLSQEALTNTLKHARAKHFRLSIIKSYPHIIFAAEDDGMGFDSDGFGKNKGSLGLLSMRERAFMLGENFPCALPKKKGRASELEFPFRKTHAPYDFLHIFPEFPCLRACQWVL